MSLLRAVGRRLPFTGWLFPHKTRRPTAVELMGMDRADFREFIETTGLAARVSNALRKQEHDAT